LEANYFAALVVIPTFLRSLVMSQLIINLDDNLLQAAREYAHRHGQELDKLVAELLQATVRPAAAEPAPTARTQVLSARVQKLYGALKAPAGFDYKKELEDGLANKYGV